jgi:hypothetical protein
LFKKEEYKMARIDAQLLLSENQAVTGASANSSVIDLGSTGGFMHPLYFDVKLTTKMFIIHHSQAYCISRVTICILPVRRHILKSS